MSSEELPRRFGKYVLLERLAEGGSGAVYLAIAEGNSERLIVIKRLLESSNHSNEAIQRLMHEATIAVRVDSPHVVRVLDVGAVGANHFLAMEYVLGWTVSQILQSLSSEQRMLKVEEIIALVIGGLRGLHALHTAVHHETHELLGVVHRDLSPRNLIITPDARMVVIDLGLGKSSMQEWITRTGAINGTPGYMSPEQITKRHVDHRSDIFSMGVLLFELLTVERYIAKSDPFTMMQRTCDAAFRPPSRIRPGIPVALDAILERALALRPELRFGSAPELADALAQAVPESAHASGRLDVGAELLSALARTERQMKSLLDAGAWAELAEDGAPTRLFATRVTDPGEPITQVSRRTESFDSQGTTMKRAQPPRSPKRAIAAVAAAVVVLAAAGTIAFLDRRRDDPVALTPSRPKAITSTAAVVIEARNEEPDESDRAPARAPITHAQQRIHINAPIRDRDGGVAEPSSAQADFARLIRRAVDLRARTPNERAALDQLITDASLSMRTSDVQRAKSELDRLTRQLHDIEARAH